MEELVDQQLNQTLDWWKSASMEDLDVVRRTIDYEATLNPRNEVLSRFARLGYLLTLQSANRR